MERNTLLKIILKLLKKILNSFKDNVQKIFLEAYTGW